MKFLVSFNIEHTKFYYKTISDQEEERIGCIYIVFMYAHVHVHVGDFHFLWECLKGDIYDVLGYAISARKLVQCT